MEIKHINISDYSDSSTPFIADNIDIESLPQDLARQIINHFHHVNSKLSIWVNLNINKLLDVAGWSYFNYSKYMSSYKFIEEHRLKSEISPSNLELMKLDAMINRYNRVFDLSLYNGNDSKAVGKFIFDLSSKLGDGLSESPVRLRLLFDIIIPFINGYNDAYNNLLCYRNGIKIRYFKSVLSEIYRELIYITKTSIAEKTNAFATLYGSVNALICKNDDESHMLDSLFIKYLEASGYEANESILYTYASQNTRYMMKNENFLMKEASKYVSHNDYVDRFDGEYYTESVYESNGYSTRGVNLFVESKNMESGEIMCRLRFMEENLNDSSLKIPQEKLRDISEYGKLIPCVSENDSILHSCTLLEYKNDIYLLYKNDNGMIYGTSLLDESIINLI